jgi:hypothetical protein
MTLVHRYPKWRQADDLPVYRTLLGPTRIIDGERTLILHDERREYRTQWQPMAGVDFADNEFSLDLFEMYDNEGGAQCPCGDQIGASDVGELLDNIQSHCVLKDHPNPMPGLVRR